MNKKILIKLTNYILSFAVLVTTVVVCISFFLSTDTKDFTGFRATVSTYKTSQFELKDSTYNNEVSYTPIKNYYTGTSTNITLNSSISDTSNVITISTSDDLYAFSLLTNSNSAFLDNSFLLLNNIEYSNVQSQFVPIGWNNNTFSGTFDGNGYEISNLRLIQLTSENYGENKTYANMTYYAMFSQNSGTIKNLGIINPSLVANTSVVLQNMLGVGVIAGLNTGTIENVYTTTLGNPLDEIGITTAGGYVISGFVVTNNSSGIIKNSYAAYDIVVNYRVKDYVSFREFINYNSGTIENCYFYNSSIDSYTELGGNKASVAYDNGLIGKTFTVDVVSGLSGITTLSDFNTDTFINLGYYVGASYNNSNFSSSLGIVTPILRGLKEVHADNKYSYEISSGKDYIYMYELFNSNAYFSSNNITYLLTKDIDLSIYDPSFYSYNDFIYSSIIGKSLTGTVTNIADQTSEYPTIYGATIENSSLTSGIQAYGLFPLFAGTIQNINVYSSAAFSGYSGNQDTKSIGGLIGYSEGATIDNVNLYISSISLPTGTYRAYVGGLIGITTSGTNLSNITVTGNIVGGSHTKGPSKTGYLDSDSIGGIVGYSTIGGVSLDTCLSALSISSANTASAQAIGGILGSGYVSKFEKVTNKSNITLDTFSGEMYSAGVIGRLLGVSQQILNIHNQGNITATLNANDNYISGVMNVDLVTSTSTGLSQSTYKTRKGLPLFSISSVTNCNDFTFTGSSTNNYVAGVIYLKSANGFTSETSGIYNTAYQYTRSGTSYSNSKHTTDLDINISVLTEFAPVMVSNSNNATFSTNASTIYNLRSINYNTTSDVSFSEMKYSGCLSGSNFKLTNIRNEGSLVFNINNSITGSGDFKVYGLFEEVSSGFSASTAINSGDISFILTCSITCNVSLSGICYENKYNSSLDINNYNPLSNSFEKDTEGTLNNAINNGVITCSNGSYSSITYSETTKKSINGQQNIKTVYTLTNDNVWSINGDINVAGITNINYSIITNSFNLGDIFSTNYITKESMTYVNCGGISVYNIGQYSYILNCSNNGFIKALNLSQSSYSNVNASGISVRNDRTSDGSNYNNNLHTRQMICFTINYGSILAYNNKENITNAANETSSKSTGILAMGLCSTINVVNYGTIYGNESVSGIIGIVSFSQFDGEVSSSNQVYLSNSINYGRVYAIDKGTNKCFGDVEIPKYEQFKSFDSSFISAYAKVEIKLEEGNNIYLGSIFSIINFDKKENSKYVKIRYVLSFLDDVKLVSSEANSPSLEIDNTNIYSAYYKQIAGVHTFSKYMGQDVTYAPLSTSYETIRNVDYIGVFNKNFTFRKAIEGALTLDTVENPTDIFLTDYFQFIAYNKVNEELLDKIGWRAIAYDTAANDFARDLNSLLLLIGEYKQISGNTYNNLVTNALSNTSWLQNCSTADALSIVDSMFDNYEYSTIIDLLEYSFSSDTTNSVLITESLRQSIVDRILTLDSNALKDYALEINDNYYTLLADVISNGNSTAYNYIYDYLTNTDNFTNDQLSTLVSSYLTYLENTSTGYFDLDSGEILKYDLLNEIFEFASSDFISGVMNYLSDDSQLKINNYSIQTSSIEKYSTYAELTDEQKKALYISILTNNDETKISTYLEKMIHEIMMYEELVNNDFEVSDFDELNKSASVNASSTDELVINDRIELYNQIKNTNTFLSYISGKVPATLYAPATEYRNTYQSTTAPVGPTGSISGDLSYLYTTEITPNTYFYGPYNADGIGVNKTDLPCTVVYIDGEITYKSTATNGYYSLFSSTDSNYLNNLINDDLIYDYHKFYYEYGVTGTNNQLAGYEYFEKGNSIPMQGKFSDFSGCQTIYGGSISAYDDTKPNEATIGCWIEKDANGTETTIQGSKQAWTTRVLEIGIAHYI